MQLTKPALVIIGLLLGVTSFAQIADTDGDGVENAADNCLLVANASQQDTDLDAWGNACDPDFNNDGQVDFQDYSMLTANFLSNAELYDMDGNGVVNFAEIFTFANYFGQPPGPAGFAIALGGNWCIPTNWMPNAVPTSLTSVFITDINTIELCEWPFNPPPPAPDNIIDVVNISVAGDLTFNLDGQFSDPIQILSDIDIFNGSLMIRSGQLGSSDPLIIEGNLTLNQGDLNLEQVDVTINGVLGIHAGNLELRGSALRNTRVETGQFGAVQIDSINVDINTLDNVILAGQLDLSMFRFAAMPLLIENGLVLDGGEILMGGGGNTPLTFAGSQSLGGQGFLRVVPGGAQSVINLLESQSVLTIESGVTVEVDGMLKVNAVDSDLILNGVFAVRELDLIANKLQVNGELELADSFSSDHTHNLESVVEISQSGLFELGGSGGFSGNTILTISGDLVNAGSLTLFGNELVVSENYINTGVVEIYNGILNIGNEVDDIWQSSGTFLLCDSDLVVFATFDTTNLSHSCNGNSVVVSGKMLNQNSTLGSFQADLEYRTPLEIVGGRFPLAPNPVLITGSGQLIFDGVEITRGFDLDAETEVIVQNGLTLKFGSEVQSSGATFDFIGTQTLSGENGGGSIVWQSAQPLTDEQLISVSGNSPTLTVDENIDFVFDVPSATIGSAQGNLVLQNHSRFTSMVNNASIAGSGVELAGMLEIEDAATTSTISVVAPLVDLSGRVTLGKNVHLVLDAADISWRNNPFSFIDMGAILSLNSQAINLEGSNTEIRAGDLGAGRVDFASVPTNSSSNVYHVSIEDGFAPLVCTLFSVVTHPLIDPNDPFLSAQFFTAPPNTYSLSVNQLPNALDVGIGPLGSCL